MDILKFKKVFIIAEAGVNHDGSLNQAFKLIDIAANAKADAVKFQTFQPGECTGRFSFKVDYINKTTSKDESRYDMSARLALSYDDFRKLKNYSEKKGILFLSTPDGYESLHFLVDELDIPLIKVGSTEVTHLEFLKEVAKKNRPIIFSTGMSTLGEVETGLDIMCHYTNKEIVLLHCTSEYPTPYNEANLRAMVTLQDCFKRPVGLSDHTTGFEATIAAVALGAKVIEKHFTIDNGIPGPDHKASLSPDELSKFVEGIRRTEILLGDGIKRPTPSELKNMSGIRRSIVAASTLQKGTLLTKEILTFKRPGTGINPEFIDIVDGMKINRDLDTDEPLQWNDLK